MLCECVVCMRMSSSSILHFVIPSSQTGNMALQFDNEGTCLIVRQYLERSRNILRSKLGEKIHLLFENNGGEATSSDSGTQTLSQHDVTATTLLATTTIQSRETPPNAESNGKSLSEANHQIPTTSIKK